MDKKLKKLNLDKWKGHCKKSFAKLGYRSVDDFIDDIRGRPPQPRSRHVPSSGHFDLPTK